MTVLDIVIVNWNSGEHLRACIESIAAEPVRGTQIQIIVVDNASSDTSVDGLDGNGLPLKLIRNQKNAGFARACNQGARAGSAPLVLFLNPDCRVSAAQLERVAGYMMDEATARVGICGVQLQDEHGVIARSCSRNPTARDIVGRSLLLDRIVPRLVPPHFLLEWDHADTRKVQQVIGAFYCVRRNVFDEMGGFDERFFVYYEEVDFAARTAAAGYEIHYLADVTVTHFGCGTTDSIRATRQFYVTRSRIQYAWKHFRPAKAVAATIATAVLEPALRSAALAASGDPQGARATLQAGGMLWRELGRRLMIRG